MLKVCLVKLQAREAKPYVPGANILHVLLALPCPAAHLHRTACVGCIPPRRSCGPLGVGCPQKSWRGPRCRMISEETDSSWHMRYLAPQIPSSTSFPSSRLPFTLLFDLHHLRRSCCPPSSRSSLRSLSSIASIAINCITSSAFPAIVCYHARAADCPHLFISRSRKQSFSPPRSHGGNGCDRHALRSIR